jgi:signal transduction histidine kinase
VFTNVKENHPVAAGARMATMDRRFAEVNHALTELRESAAGSQQRSFARQLAAASAEAKHVYLVAALLLLMVGGACLYGHRLARQVQSDAVERARQSRELEASNERLQAETRRKVLALEALRQANEKLQSLFKRTLELQEQKQQHIARELHEDVSQTLASLKMQLSAPRTGAPALRAAGLAEDALHRLRDLAHDLTPHGMEHVGLPAVLRAHLDEWTRGSRLRVGFVDRVRVRPPFRIEHAAYREAQEAVANVLRHAAARSLLVELRGSAEELQLRVVDDGSGFDLQAARSRASLGMALMEQRTAMVGGTIEIRSAPGEGSSVIVTFPLQQQMDWMRDAGFG